LGAARADIRRLVLTQGMRPAATGAIIGLLIALAAARTIQSMLFGVTSADLVTYGGALLVIAMSVLVACLLPANRAARIEPAVALRSE
jgi:putative ABC transport system permease protein